MPPTLKYNIRTPWPSSPSETRDQSSQQAPRVTSQGAVSLHPRGHPPVTTHRPLPFVTRAEAQVCSSQHVVQMQVNVSIKVVTL